MGLPIGFALGSYIKANPEVFSRYTSKRRGKDTTHATVKGKWFQKWQHILFPTLSRDVA